MYQLNYDKTIPGGKIEEASGAYEAVKRIIMPENFSLSLEPGFVAKLKEMYKNTYTFEFDGNEPMEHLETVVKIIKEIVPNKNYRLVTNAPAHHWWKQKGKTQDWKFFDKIIIQRLSKDDDKNNELLGVKALSQDDYVNMPNELKSKITFLVDYQKADFENEVDIMEIILWASKIGINNVVFIGTDEELIKYQQQLREQQKEKDKSKAGQIKAFRERRFKPELVKTKKIEIIRPLLCNVQKNLIKYGWNFKLLKAVSEKEKFFSIRTLECQALDMEVSFKIKTTRNQEEFWQVCRSHKYVQELKM